MEREERETRTQTNRKKGGLFGSEKITSLRPRFLFVVLLLFSPRKSMGGGERKTKRLL
jgi:hypothetical protein